MPKSDATVKKLLRDECRIVIGQIATALEKSLSKINLTLDIWTQPGMKYSYLGVTAHFINCSFEATRLILLIFSFSTFIFWFIRAFLGLIDLPPSHTAAVVKTNLDKIMSYYKLNEEDVFAIITDNGSNVVCAFKDDYEGLQFLVSK